MDDAHDAAGRIDTFRDVAFVAIRRCAGSMFALQALAGYVIGVLHGSDAQANSEMLL